MKKDNLIGLIIFVVSLILFVSCNMDYVNEMLQEGSTVIDTELKPVAKVSVMTGFTDSITMRVLSFTGHDSLSRESNPRGFLDAWNGRVKSVKISWSSVTNAAGYELRVSRKPITEKNWYSAVRVDYIPLKEEGGEVFASIHLSKSEITTSKCVDCGECVKACPFDAISSINSKAVVDPNKCVSCGECYAACKYDALDGFFGGHPYYFAVRSLNADQEVSATITCTSSPYALKYQTIAVVPDSLKGFNIKGCGGNCGIEYNEETGDCENGSCYIVLPRENYYYPKGDPKRHKNVCPVDAIEDYNDSLDGVTVKHAIYLNKDKCIECGRCVSQCAYDNGHGAVSSEVQVSEENHYGRE